jgi:predicted transcriptional regulator
MPSKPEKGRKISAAMKLRGITCVDIGKKLGVSGSMVSMVIHGRATSQRVVEALIEAGVPERLFKKAS